MPPVGRPRTRTGLGIAPPTTELGIQVPPGFGEINPLSGAVRPWSMFVDDQELVPELRWPQSVATYDRMRTDPQLAGLLTAVIYGISKLNFVIDPNGAREEIVTRVSQDLNLPIMGEDEQPKGRMKKRFVHRKHMVQALKAIIYGHMYFEQVGTIVDDMWRLRKLAVRVPQYIGQINVAEDGGLVSVKQSISRTNQAPLGLSMLGGPEIPVDRLIAFVFEQEGANWVGRSILRDCYKSWLLKDRLVRIDAINHERAGGVPYGIAPPEAAPGEIDELNKMMQAFRVGETAGGAVPFGTKVEVARGSDSKVFDSIRGHDEAMARRFLLMLANLAQGGQHVGSYALGEVFQDFFILGQHAICDWYVDVMNEHMIEDWVDWNYKDEEFCPLLAYEGEDDVLGVEPLTQLVDADVVRVDDELEDKIRYRYKLGKRGTPREPLVDPNGGEPGGDGSVAPSQPEPPAQSQASARVRRRRSR